MSWILFLKLTVQCPCDAYLRDYFVAKAQIQVTETAGENTNVVVYHEFAWTEELPVTVYS